MTLLEQINEYKYEIFMRESAIAAYKKELKKLEDSRAYCEHIWGDPTPYYEHEGSLCTLCGINSVFAPTHKRMVESK
jgi:hypothetical protein